MTYEDTFIDPRQRRPVVIAGNYSEFIIWCKNNRLNPRDCVYYDSLEKIMGLSKFALIKIGTYYERKDATKLIEEAEFRESLFS